MSSQQKLPGSSSETDDEPGSFSYGRLISGNARIFCCEVRMRYLHNTVLPHTATGGICYSIYWDFPLRVLHSKDDNSLCPREGQFRLLPDYPG